MIFALTGCGLLPFENPFASKEKEQLTNAPPPPQLTPASNPANSASTNDNRQAGTMPDMTASASAPTPDGAAPMNGTPDANNAPDGYVQVPAPPPPAQPLDPIVAAGPLDLAPDGSMGSLGLNLDEYFDDTAPTDERLTRVERAVAAMQRDLHTLAPPIKRLIGVERDIQSLVGQLAELTQAPPPSPPVMNSPYSAMAANAGASPQSLYSAPAGTEASGLSSMTATQASATSHGSGGAQAASGATIRELRTGEHKDKTRIVLDASGPASYRYDLDNGEKLLVIELPGTSWSGATQKSYKRSPILASYNVYPMDGGGSRVVVQLKKATSVSYETVIKPNGNKNYRIVIDLKK